MAPHPIFASKWCALRDAIGWTTKAMEAEGFTQFSERSRKETPFDHRALFKWQKGTGRPTKRQEEQLAAKIESAGYSLDAAARIVGCLMDEDVQLDVFCQELQQPRGEPLIQPLNVEALKALVALREAQYQRVMSEPKAGGIRVHYGGGSSQSYSQAQKDARALAMRQREEALAALAQALGAGI